MLLQALVVLSLAAPPRAELEARLAALEPKVATDARAACNAGWLRFQLGDLPGAARDLDSGLGRLATGGDPKVLGACWYNRGRVHEAAKEAPAARAAYEKSLAARPGNAEVEKRLIAVGGKPPPEVLPWSTDAGPWREAPPALAQAARPLLDINPPPRDDGVALVGPEVALEGAALDRAALVWLGKDLRPRDGNDWWGELILVVRIGGTWRGAARLGWLEDGGAVSGTIAARLELANDAVGPRVLLRYDVDTLSHEAGSLATREDHLLAAWPVGDRVAVRDLLIGTMVSYEPMGDGRREDGPEEEYWSLKATVDAKGTLIVQRGEGRLPGEVRGQVGKGPLRVEDPTR